MARCSQLMCVWDFTWCKCVEMWFINRARKLSQNARMLGAGLWRLRRAQRNRWMTCIVQLGAATHSVTSMHIIQSVRCPLDFNRLLGARLLGCIGMCRPSWSRIFFRYWSLRQPVKSATTFFVCRPFIENACVRMAWVTGVPISIGINCTKIHRSSGWFLVLFVFGKRPLHVGTSGNQMHHKLAPLNR